MTATRRPDSFSPATGRVLALLGTEIARDGRERRYTLADSAERAGISVGTLRQVEHGAAPVAIGIVLETAHLVGLPIVATEDELEATRETITVVGDQRGSPTWSRDRARALWALVRSGPPGHLPLDRWRSDDLARLRAGGVRRAGR